MAHLPDRSPAPFHWQFLSTRAAGQDPYSSERLHRHWTAPTTAPKESSIATQMGPEHWHNEEVPLIPHDKLKDDRDTEEPGSIKSSWPYTFLDDDSEDDNIEMEDIELKRKGSHRENKGASPRQSLDHTGRGQESCFKPLDVCFALAPFSLCLDDHSIPLGRGYQKRSGESASYQTGLGLERPEPIPKQALTSHVSFNPYDGISEPDEISEADGTSEVGGTSEPDGNSALPFNDRSLSPTSEDCVIIFNDTDVEYTLSHDFVVVEATSIMGDT